MEPDPVDIKLTRGSTVNHRLSPLSALCAAGQPHASIGPGPSQPINDRLPNPTLELSRIPGCVEKLASQNLQQFSQQSQQGVPPTFEHYQPSTTDLQLGEFVGLVDHRQRLLPPTSLSSGSQITSLQLQAPDQDSPCFSTQQLGLCAENNGYRHLIPPNFPRSTNEWMCNQEFQKANGRMYAPPACPTFQQANPSGQNIVDIRGTKFPQRLWSLLQNAEETQSIHWNPYGTGFVIDHDAFEKEILSTGHFKTIKITSFVRQLNLYGFRKVKKALSNEQQVYLRSKKKTNQGKLVMLREYRHEFFRRDARHLLSKVVRKTSHGHRSGVYQEAPSSSGQLQAVNAGLLQMQRFDGGPLNGPINGEKESNNVLAKLPRNKFDPGQEFPYQASTPPQTLTGTNPTTCGNIPHESTAASACLHQFVNGSNIQKLQEVNVNFGNHPISDQVQRPGPSWTPFAGATNSSPPQNGQSPVVFGQRRVETPRSADGFRMMPELMEAREGPVLVESPSSSIFHQPSKQSPSAVQFSSATTLPQPDLQPSWVREAPAPVHQQMVQQQPVQALTFNGPFESIPNAPTYSALLQSNINGRPFAQYLTPVQTKPLALTRSVRSGAIDREFWGMQDISTRFAEEKQYPMDLTYPFRANTAPTQSGDFRQEPTALCPATEFPSQQAGNHFPEALFDGSTCQGGSSNAGSTPNSDILRHPQTAKPPLLDYRWSPISGSLQLAPRNSYDYANEVNPQSTDWFPSGDGGAGNNSHYDHGGILDFTKPKPGKMAQITEWMDKNDSFLEEAMPVTTDGAQKEFPVHTEACPVKAGHSLGVDEIALALSDRTISSASTPSSMTTFYANDPLPDQRTSSQSAHTSEAIPVYQDRELSNGNEWARFPKAEFKQEETSRMGMGIGKPSGVVDCGQVSWCFMPQHGRKF